MTKWIKTVDGVVDTIAIERPGHFEAETYQEEVSRDIPVLDGEGNPTVDENGQPVTETVKVMEDRRRQVFVPDETFVEGPDDVFAGFAFDGQMYTAPAPPTPSIDPNDYPLNRFQFEALVVAIGLSFSAIESAIDAMSLNDFEKAVGKSRLRNANSYHRAHPLVEAVRAKLGMPVAELDSTWLMAKDLR